MAIYVCSDIHGYFKLYQKMLEKINFSDEDTLFIIGDMVDRGPDSIKLLQDIMERDNVICLMGNHELMMLDSLVPGPPAPSDIWLNPRNGGQKTYHQFEALAESNQQQIIDFLRNLYLQYEVDLENHKYLLSHSSFAKDFGTAKCIEFPERVVTGVVWRSPWRHWEYVPSSYYDADGRVHIIGHVPVHSVREEDEQLEAIDWMPEAFVKGNIINIDCGCAYINRNLVKYSSLCCLNLTEYDKGNLDSAFTYIPDSCLENDAEEYAETLKEKSTSDLLDMLLEEYDWVKEVYENTPESNWTKEFETETYRYIEAIKQEVLKRTED